MLNAINEYYNLAKVLDHDSSKESNLSIPLLKYANHFLEKSNNMKAFYYENKLEDNFFNKDSLNETSSVDEVIEFLENILNQSGLNTASPNHFGFIPGYGVYLSAIADFITSIFNQFPSSYATSPAAVRLENSTIKWICNLIGYPENSGGVLTSGGSMANLIAIAAARDHFSLTKKIPKNTVVYLTVHTHHSICKALKISGMGEVIIREIKVDELYKMKPHLLQKAIETDLAAGLLPWMVVCSAGTTDIGSVDPINEIEKIGHHFQMWVHVDAAYGGFFILTKEGKKLLNNIHCADSITLDPHKSLFLPYGTGSVIVKNQSHLLECFSLKANYLRDNENNIDHISPADISPELSRNLRALRLWLPIKLYGINPFKAALEEKLLLAKYFYKEIKKINRIEIACKPELTIVTFRYLTKNKDKINEFNQKLIQEIQIEGKIYLTSTTLNQNIYLRLACLSFKTHIENIQLAIQIIKEKIEFLLIKNEF